MKNVLRKLFGSFKRRQFRYRGQELYEEKMSLNGPQYEQIRQQFNLAPVRGKPYLGVTKEGYVLDIGDFAKIVTNGTTISLEAPIVRFAPGLAT